MVTVVTQINVLLDTLLWLDVLQIINQCIQVANERHTNTSRDKVSWASFIVSWFGSKVTLLAIYLMVLQFD